MLIDIKKAHDAVRRNAMTYKLRKKIKLFKHPCHNTYAELQNTYSEVRTHDKYLSHVFKTEAGVVQGSVISPILHGVFMNDILKLSQAFLSLIHSFGMEFFASFSNESATSSNSCLEALDIIRLFALLC